MPDGQDMPWRQNFAKRWSRYKPRSEPYLSRGGDIPELPISGAEELSVAAAVASEPGRSAAAIAHGLGWQGKRGIQKVYRVTLAMEEAGTLESRLDLSGPMPGMRWFPAGTLPKHQPDSNTGEDMATKALTEGLTGRALVMIGIMRSLDRAGSPVLIFDRDRLTLNALADRGLITLNVRESTAVFTDAGREFAASLPPSGTAYWRDLLGVTEAT